MKVISSASQSVELLRRLRERSIPVRVEFSIPFTTFFFEGFVTGVTEMLLEVEGRPEGSGLPPRLTLQLAGADSFSGEYGEESCFLNISRSADKLFLYRCIIESGWDSEERKNAESRPH